MTKQDDEVKGGTALDDINNQFATLQNFLDMDLFNDIVNVEVEDPTAAKPPPANVFDQLDALGNLLGQTEDEFADLEMELLAQGSVTSTAPRRQLPLLHHQLQIHYKYPLKRRAERKCMM
jgi:hypothetical protein